MAALDDDAFDKLLELDVDGLLDMPEKPKKLTGSDRLARAFLEIADFYRDNDRIPSSETRNIAERKLGARLDGILASPEKTEALRYLDEFGLLEDPTPPTSLDELLEDDFGLLDDDSGIFDLSELPAEAFTEVETEVAQRTRANDFEAFEALFKQKHEELKEGSFTLIPFKGLQTIKEGSFFVLGGVLLFVAEVGETVMVPSGGTSVPKERLRVIFENGTESSMYRQSLGSRLYEKNGQSVVRTGFSADEIGDADVNSGHLYVVKSLSTNPDIATYENLYKIGFSTTPVAQRVANAENEATYLMAPVEIVADYRVYNMRPSAFENLVHRVFAPVKVDLTQVDTQGNVVHPSEWFVAPLPIIDQALTMIVSGDIVNYVYDPQVQQLVPRTE